MSKWSPILEIARKFFLNISTIDLRAWVLNLTQGVLCQLWLATVMKQHLQTIIKKKWFRVCLLGFVHFCMTVVHFCRTEPLSDVSWPIFFKLSENNTKLSDIVYTIYIHVCPTKILKHVGYLPKVVSYLFYYYYWKHAYNATIFTNFKGINLNLVYT